MSDKAREENEKVVREAVMSLGNWLLDNRIPSFGPETGMVLLRIKQSLEEKMKGVTDPLLLLQLKRYSEALDEVVIVSAIHQKFVIEGLAALVEGRKP